MSEVPEGILDTLDTMLESMITKIDLEAQKQIEMIEKETNAELKRINDLKNTYQKNDSNITPELLQEINVRRRIWFKQFNQERSTIIDQFYIELQQMIQKTTKNKPFFRRILESLLTEILKSIDREDISIHVTKGAKDIVKNLEFGNNNVVKITDDLTEVGIVIEIPDKGITIYNTLESRLKLIKKDISILINNILFKDLEEPPWSVSKTLDTLMLDSTD